MTGGSTFGATVVGDDVGARVVGVVGVTVCPALVTGTPVGTPDAADGFVVDGARRALVAPETVVSSPPRRSRKAMTATATSATATPAPTSRSNHCWSNHCWSNHWWSNRWPPNRWPPNPHPSPPPAWRSRA
jgi:hypothetical protein